MEISSLASGSNGNCFYVGNKKSGILIDAGISAKQISERLELIKKKSETIKGIFITHEHSDHIRGAEVFSKQFNTPIFATKKTIENCSLCFNPNQLNIIKNNETIQIAKFEVEAFSKSHKAGDPVSYTITSGKRASIITDLGYCCKNTIKNVTESNLLFLESNHDIRMLENGPYPYFLKKWIKSDEGHLSNLQASLCILEHATPKLKHIILSHLSKTNNTPELALHTINSLIKERKDLSPRISVSSREMPTKLIEL